MSDVASWETGAVNVILPLAFFTVFVLFLNFYDKYSKESHLRIADKKHTWRPINSGSESLRCSICEVLMVTIDGVYCDSCGVCADTNCLRRVAQKFRCKEISLDSDGPMKHRWLKGNLPDSCSCDVCSSECADDLRCIWCHRTVHNNCIPFLGEVCDFGLLKQVVVPPTHVHLGKKKARVVRRGLELCAISEPAIVSWKPLFVIGNPASGSRVGEQILSGFRFFLNPLQVSELSPKALARLAYILCLLPESSCPIILVAGGDGSVAAVLSALYKNRQSIKCVYRVAIVPLGTGNDLSRVLGWGSEEPSPFSPVDLLNKLLTATPLQLDRWEVKVPKGRQLGIERRAQTSCMYNYMSVGVDARVTLDFHRARNSLYLGGRLINKALYLAFGTQQVVERNCTGLEKEIELELDGLAVNLPDLEAVVLLNIPSWGAGCDLWNLKEADEEISEQSISDGKLEVCGIYSSFHMAQLQVGLSTPYRIGQASVVRIRLKKKLPMQIDGEPWIQPPGTVEVKRGGQVTLLSPESLSQS